MFIKPSRTHGCHTQYHVPGELSPSGGARPAPQHQPASSWTSPPAPHESISGQILAFSCSVFPPDILQNLSFKGKGLERIQEMFLNPLEGFSGPIGNSQQI